MKQYCQPNNILLFDNTKTETERYYLLKTSIGDLMNWLLK